jgi:hypothetical protein
MKNGLCNTGRGPPGFGCLPTHFRLITAGSAPRSPGWRVTGRRSLLHPRLCQYYPLSPWITKMLFPTSPSSSIFAISSPDASQSSQVQPGPAKISWGLASLSVYQRSRKPQFSPLPSRSKNRPISSKKQRAEVSYKARHNVLRPARHR